MKEVSNTPNIPRPASTVILIRWQGGELQVYLLKRSTNSGFMPGNYVFPGGTVDAHDRAPGLWKKHVDMDLDEISRRLGGGLTGEEALDHGVAAIRETFEEAGVFLSGGNSQTVKELERVREQRMTGSLPSGWLQEWAAATGGTLSFSSLARWAHWITPKLRSRRYDTRFFLAFTPLDQKCTPDNRETTHGIWISPEQGLARNLRREIPLSPPALVTLHELLQYRDPEDLKREAETRSWGEVRMPRLIRLTDGALLILPWDPMYNQDVEMEKRGPDDGMVLPPGEPFSRLWYHEGIWMPVGA